MNITMKISSFVSFIIVYIFHPGLALDEIFGHTKNPPKFARVVRKKIACPKVTIK